jgi:tetratricopeptide (TPR) repeat protein
VSESRLLSGVGNRYDYWRIAWRVWRAHPVLGVGAGNYPRSYYEQRATTEDIEQPHSIELQALSELGLAGALLLLCFVGGVGWGAFRMRARAIEPGLTRALLVAGLGAFAAWLAQTSVDWMHLLPGLTAFALAAASVVVSRWPQPARVEASGHAAWLTHALTGTRARALGAAAVIVTLIVTGASLSRQGLADLYRSRAQSELASRPAEALADADRSLDIDSDSTQSYYIKAAALARFDQAAPATAALDGALAREPGNFVTWALLGDLAVRERMFPQAKRDYDRAHQLDPKDETFRALALDPRAAFR